MPWTVEDVDGHKKGLTAKQKKQWVRIANAVLKTCMSKGGTDEECAPKAIKQANGVVLVINKDGGQYASYASKQTLDYEPKIVIHQEKPHLVVPVVMMVQGVHCGSLGAIYHSIEELGRFPESWNGIPVVIYHPEKEGQPVSANSPDIIDQVTVGRVYNTTVEDNKLKAEVWLDEDKLNTVSEKTLVEINESKEIEVSLGMFADYEEEEGEYEGETYARVAFNHRPDHLAILPDQIGACSCEDGCGIGANQKKKDMERTKKPKTQEMLVAINEAGYAFNKIGVHAETNYQQRISMANEALRKLDVNIYNYLEELYDTYLIYCQSGSGEYKMYKQEYKVDSGKVEFVGAPVEVHKKVEYIVNTTMTRTKVSINHKKEDKKMSNASNCPKCLEKVDALIANGKTWTEADREWLLTQEESVLDRLAPVVNTVEKIVEKTVEVNKQLAPEDAAALATYKKQLATIRSERISRIQTNTSKEQWPDAILNAMNDETLERLDNSVKKEEEMVDYSLSGGHVIQNNGNSEEPMLPTGQSLEVKK